MSVELYDLNPVSRIVVGAVGQPGQRTFLLQASDSEQSICLKLEKEQVGALARGIDEMLKELEAREMRLPPPTVDSASSEQQLEEPLDPVFVVGQMGLAFDPDTDRIILVAQEIDLAAALAAAADARESEDAQDIEAEDLPPEAEEEREIEEAATGVASSEVPSLATARFWATPAQMRDLAEQAGQIIAKGRPLCPLCRRPMDPGGHFCPRGNGHSKQVVED